MDKRLHKAKRILKVQEQLQKMAEWKLVDLARQAAELRDAQETLIQTLNDDEILYGLFVESRARRLQTLAGEASQVDEAQGAQRKIVLDRSMQVKRTEQMLETLTEEHRRASEKKDYLALLDNLSSKSDASLP